MGKYIRHAFDRSFHSMGGTGLVASSFAIPFVGFALHFVVAGEAAMTAELKIWAIYVLAAAGLVFLAIFLWNLACAPFRIERSSNKDLSDKLSKAEVERDSYKEQLAARGAVLSAEFDGTIFGADAFLKEYEGLKLVFVNLAIRNKGLYPSIADSFSVHVSRDGEEDNPIMVMTAYDIRLSIGNNERDFFISKDEYIIRKAEQAIQPGTIVRGGIMMFVQPKFADSGTTVKVSFRDIHGKEYSAEHTLGPSERPNGYVPGLS